MRNIFGIATACVWLALAPPTWADSQQLRTIKQKAEEVAKATVEGDYAGLADHTHPKVLQMIGGRDKMIEVVKSTMAEMKTKGITVNSVQVEAPTQVVKGGADLLAIVPTTVTMKLPGNKAVQRSYLVAVSSDLGKTWTFIDGIQLSEKNIRRFLPDFPGTLKLPEKQMPVIEKDK